MDAFLKGTDEAFDALLNTVRGVGTAGAGAGERALVGVPHAATGATALMAAAGKGRHVEIGQLLGCGADPTQKSKDGSTAADWARRFGHEDIAATLDEAREQLERLASAEDAALTMSQYQLQADPDEVDLDLAQELIHWILRNRAEEMQRESGGPAGAILVFLPGWNEISQLRDQLAADARFGADVLVLPLHSMVPPSEQKRVFQRPPRGVKKVVLATNIAETAVTIDDVVFVVDSGRLKEKSYDALTGVSTLQAAWISRASAQQRRGRAGRVRPGECYRLYSSARMAAFADFQLPEMQRSPLEELCLQVRMLAEASSLGGERGGGAAAVGTGAGSTAAFLLQAVEPPVPQAISNAVGLLQDIGALKEDESLTRLGRHLGRCPCILASGRCSCTPHSSGSSTRCSPSRAPPRTARRSSCPWTATERRGRRRGTPSRTKPGADRTTSRWYERLRGGNRREREGRRRTTVQPAQLHQRRHPQHAQGHAAAARDGARGAWTHRGRTPRERKRLRRFVGARGARRRHVPAHRATPSSPARGKPRGAGRKPPSPPYGARR